MTPPPLDLLVVWLTTGCQLRCRYCYMQAGDGTRQDLSPALFAQALTVLPFRRGAELLIVGGEPTLVPDILADVGWTFPGRVESVHATLARRTF